MKTFQQIITKVAKQTKLMKKKENYIIKQDESSLPLPSTTSQQDTGYQIPERST